MRLSLALLTAIFVVSTSGCASFSSTMLNRLDDNSLFGNSNGESRDGLRTRPYKGIPITLRLPTHLDVFIDEQYYLKIQGKVISEPLESQCRLLSVRTEKIYSDKVFTVDFKRPASGTLGLNLELDEDEQYFKSIESKLEDDSITASAALLAGVIDSVQLLGPTSGIPTGGPSEAGDAESIAAAATIKPIKDTRVIAYQRFDLNAPDFEAQVAGFVSQHLCPCDELCEPAVF